MSRWIAPAAHRPLVRYVQSLAMAYFAHDLMGLAAEMSYQYLFALFPFFVFLAALLGFVGAVVGHVDLFRLVMNFIAVLGPEDIQQPVRGWVYDVVYTQSPALLTVGAVGSLFGATAGIGTLVKGLNRAHGVRDARPVWLGFLISLAATLTLHSVMIVGFITYAVGEWLVERMVLGYAPDEGLALWALIQAPIVTLGLFLVLTALYKLLPSTEVSFRRAIAGAVVATLGWTAITRGFNFYLAHFGQFSATYGGFATGVMLLVWLYAVGMALLVGGEISAISWGGRAPRSDA